MSPISIPVHHETTATTTNGLLKIHSPLHSPGLRKSPSPMHSPGHSPAQFHNSNYVNNIVDTSTNVRGIYLVFVLL